MESRAADIDRTATGERDTRHRRLALRDYCGMVDM